ncbi:PrpF protein [Kockovaella imperatae]|uniref:PrpF protein n=1 Tax=Kockovaella imperatae TaxID=4999 RepID=A0A1Y1UHX0_9TREE|nr:PrpF protein [Kockovaella imperatae]ORX37074.1 PrpF protein [Kockovaella imperatae]
MSSNSSTASSSSTHSPQSSPHTSPSSIALELPSPAHRRRCIRSVLMRAGTSRGLFFRTADLPEDQSLWGPILLAAMGSPDPYLRQLDGVGGGTSTTSKVAVVGPSKDPRADVDYLFVQVPVDGSRLDFSGNCGNIASGVGPFAVDEGFIKVPESGKSDVTVRIRNVNTDRIIHSTFEVQDGVPVEIGEMQLDGVGATGSPIRLDFVDPAGSMTGKLLPTGSPLDTVTLPSNTSSQPARTFTVSCVDAANPFVFVDARQLGLTGLESPAEIASSTTETLMDIRAVCAVHMGLASSHETARQVMGTPKIAIVAPPMDYSVPAVDGGKRIIRSTDVDIWIRPFSMGRPHPSIQMTGAVCVGSASAVPGTIVHEIISGSRASRMPRANGDEAVIVGHASGTMAINGESETIAGHVVVKSGSVYRTARRLMEGSVCCVGC